MKKIILPLLIILLTSCSLSGLFIRNLDYLLRSRISDKLDLVSSQKNTLNADVDGFLNNQKNRAEELKAIISGIKIEENISQQINEIRTYYYLFATEIGLIVSKYLSELNADQTAHFLKDVNKDNRKIENDLAEFELKSVYRFITFFTGDLNDEQKAIVESYKDHLKVRQADRLNRRLAVYKKMVEIFESTENRALQFNTLFNAYNDPKQAMAVTDNNLKVLEMVEKIRVSLTDKQKTYFKDKQKEILELIDVFIKTQY